MKNTKKTQPITLLEYLQTEYGKDQVKVVKWNWTKEQLTQLKKTSKKNHVKQV